MKLIHRKCGNPLVYDHIKNKWYCFKCNVYPGPADILILSKGLIEETSDESSASSLVPIPT